MENYYMFNDKNRKNNNKLGEKIPLKPASED